MASQASVGDPPKPPQAPPPPQIAIILRNIDELVENSLALNENARARYAGNDADLRDHQSSLLGAFRELMVAVQSKTAKAIHEVETKIGHPAHASIAPTAVSLNNLPGVDPASDLNRLLGCQAHPSGKVSYKLREFATDLADIELVVESDGTAPGLSHRGPAAVLQPTLRNVWVIQHAFIKMLKHKEELVKNYLDGADLKAGTSRKYLREYYEDLSLANLPWKSKLGNLLDVKRSSFEITAHDLTVVLAVPAPGGLKYVEAVTGNVLSEKVKDDRTSHLVLPVTEASMKKLYDTYRSLRKGTSSQRRATKDKDFAATQPVDAVAELEKMFNFSGREPFDVVSGGNKRRRLLDDDGGRE
ncbi:hypothetical protein GGS23DRAFT_587835 [Durotheca rogersii]|uniref:uncharacterized protein n=1 Tax=Durotheca rogersii TaxID=419775 RepID=UPI002220DF4B|nr:uncharacterized protein GGS23DRAFT_587835 [Durotheca rogersii]KAI5857385.1 hypothetical protein GGS23DRAFT_587835 [Durotheca rogersii]